MVGSGVAENKPKNNKETTKKASRALRVFTFTLPSHFSANQQPKFLKWEARERKHVQRRQGTTLGRPFPDSRGTASRGQPARPRTRTRWLSLGQTYWCSGLSLGTARSWELAEGTQDSSMGSEGSWGQSNSTAALAICLARGQPGTEKSPISAYRPFIGRAPLCMSHHKRKKCTLFNYDPLLSYHPGCKRI